MKLNYYDVLQVKPSSSTIEIKRAYRKCALLYHPDKNSSSGAQDMLIMVKEAYDVLSDCNKRREYDFSLRRSRSGKLMSQNRSVHFQNKKWKNGRHHAAENASDREIFESDAAVLLNESLQTTSEQNIKAQEHIWKFSNLNSLDASGGWKHFAAMRINHMISQAHVQYVTLDDIKEEENKLERILFCDS